MPRLRLIRGPEPGLDIELTEEIITIGRGRRNHIIIQDNEVSREHCQLVRVLDDYEIHDLNSTNGTFVNGRRVDQSGWLLGPNHIVELGDSITMEYITVEGVSGALPALPSTQELLLMMQCYLMIHHINEPEPEIYPLDQTHIQIGRDIDNDIVLQDAEVSRHHLRLIFNREGYAIEDLGTLNGTYLNGERLTELHHLRLGDHIRIGTMVEMLYTKEPDQAYFVDGGWHSAEDSHKNLHVRRKEPEGAHFITQTRFRAEIGTGLQPGELEQQVMLAYSRTDWEPIVGRLVLYLYDNAIKVWVDQYLAPGSDDWQAAIDQAQAECGCLVVVLSQGALESAHILRAMRHFLAREKPVILLQTENIERMPLIIENVPVIELDRNSPLRGFNDLLAELNDLSQS